MSNKAPTVNAMRCSVAARAHARTMMGAPGLTPHGPRKRGEGGCGGVRQGRAFRKDELK